MKSGDGLRGYVEKDAKLTSELMRKFGTSNINPDAQSVGFWNSDSPKRGGIEEVEAARGELCNEECDAVIAFIGAAEIGQRWRGMADCRSCGIMLGSCDMVTPDRAFIFPSKYEHYIVEHGVRPPEPFIKAAKEWHETQ